MSQQSSSDLRNQKEPELEGKQAQGLFETSFLLLLNVWGSQLWSPLSTPSGLRCYLSPRSRSSRGTSATHWKCFRRTADADSLKYPNIQEASLGQVSAKRVSCLQHHCHLRRIRAGYFRSLSPDWKHYVCCVAQNSNRVASCLVEHVQVRPD